MTLPETCLAAARARRQDFHHQPEPGFKETRNPAIIARLPDAAHRLALIRRVGA